MKSSVLKSICFCVLLSVFLTGCVNSSDVVVIENVTIIISNNEIDSGGDKCSIR